MGIFHVTSGKFVRFSCCRGSHVNSDFYLLKINTRTIEKWEIILIDNILSVLLGKALLNDPQKGINEVEI